MSLTLLLMTTLLLHGAATSAPRSILFLGNSYSFGWVDPLWVDDSERASKCDPCLRVLALLTLALPGASQRRRKT